MMIRLRILLVLAGVLQIFSTGTVFAEPERLSKSTDSYFMEDDQVYARFLWFKADGTYRQINRDRTTAEEVDRGRWEQDANGEVSLHPTNGMLAFRAVSAGCLLVFLDTQSQIDSLPALHDRITALLQSYQDLVFARTALAEVNVSDRSGNESSMDDAATISLSEQCDIFSRNDLLKLLRDIEVWLKAKSNNTFIFDFVPSLLAPPLLVQRGAVFSKELLPNVRATHHLKPSEASPFYFSRITRQTFLVRAGSWKPFANLGGLHDEAPVLKTVP